MKSRFHPSRVLLIFLLVFCCYGFKNVRQSTVVILSFNDLHGQIDPFIEEEEKEGSKEKVELGGCSRIASLIRSAKSRYPHAVLTVSSGDNLLGPYFNRLQGQAIGTILSSMGLDVATLGNHDFDQGETMLARALAFCRFPIVVSNLKITTDKRPLAGRISEYRVFERSGVKIGVFGIITPALPLLSGGAKDIKVKADFTAEAHRIAEILRRKEGVDIVVALTHIGLEEDEKLAEAVEGLDVICGGHTHDSLFKGDEVVIRHPNGRSTIITQAGSLGRYLGFLELTIRNGRIVEHLWEPIRIDTGIPEDPEVEELIRSFRNRMPEKRTLTVCTVPLDCRMLTVRSREAAAGDLVCDAVREYFKVDIALQNGGGIRGDAILPAGPLSDKDLDTLLPFGNPVVILKLKGSVIKQALERSVASWPKPAGAFLQESGLRYQVQPGRKPQELRSEDTAAEPASPPFPGERIAKAEVEQQDGSFQPLSSENVYTVAVNGFLASGGDGYFMFKNAESAAPTNTSVYEAVKSILAARPEISPAPDGRIQFTK